MTFCRTSGPLSLLVLSLGFGLVGCGSSDDATPNPLPTEDASATDAAADSPGDAGAEASDAAAEGGDAADAGPGDPLSWPVDHDGPFPVGYHVGHTTYQPTGGLPSRTIEVHYWYPASSATGAHPKYVNVFSDPHVFTDAPPAPPVYPNGYPILLHSHGYKGFSGNSAELFRYLATHGWVVVAPQHLGNTLTDTPDPLPLAVTLERPQDLRAGLDAALALPSTEPLGGKLDVDRLAISGHSFGTYTVWALAGATFDVDAIRARCDANPPGYPDCTTEMVDAFKGDLTEPRAKAFIPMAGGESNVFSSTSFGSNVHGPVLLMGGTLDGPAGEQKVFDEASGFDFTWIEIEGGCHQLFGLGNGSLGDPACKALPDAEGYAIVETWLLAYLRAKVLGDASADVADIVSGKKSVSSRVTYAHK